MMRNFLRGFLVGILLLGLSGVAGAEGMKEILGLKGPVQMMTEVEGVKTRNTQYLFSSQGNLEQKIDFFQDNFSKRTIELYDSKERKLDTWEVDGEKKWLSAQWEYSDQKKSFTFESFSKEGVKSLVWVGALNDQGLVEMIYSGETKKMKNKNTYDSAKRLIEMEGFGVDGIKVYAIFHYDQDQLVSTKVTSVRPGQEAEVFYDCKYSYNSKGELILEKRGNLWGKTRNLTEVRYEYSDYDSYGNWTKKMIQESGQEPVMKKRTITYYN